MTNAPNETYRFRFLLRRLNETLLAVYLLYIVYTCLIPFDFLKAGASPEARELFGMTLTDYTLPDIISNIFLYLPLGLLIFAASSRVTRGTGRSVALTLVVAAMLSVVLEWAQSYSATRISSVIDLAANVLGAILGALIAGTCRSLLPHLVGAALFELHTDPRLARVKAYCIVLVLFAAMPFSFSFDVKHLSDSVKTSTFIPFTEATTVDVRDQLASAETTFHRDSRAAYWRMDTWARWAAEAASFAVLAWLLYAAFRGSYGFRPRSSVALVGWVGLMSAFLLSILQFPVMARGFHVSDIIMRLAGLGIGVITLRRYDRFAKSASDVSRALVWQRVAWWGACGVVGYILFTGLMPFVIDPEGGPRQAVADPGFLPFQSYFGARFDRMMRNLMGKTAAYSVLAMLLCVAWTRIHHASIPRQVAAITAVGLALCIPLEVAQMYLMVRVTSLTDPIIVCTACSIGAMAYHRVAAFHLLAQSEGFTQLTERTTSNQPTAPTDRLVGTLMDEYTNAPREPGHATHPARRRY